MSLKFWSVRNPTMTTLTAFVKETYHQRIADLLLKPGWMTLLVAEKLWRIEDRSKVCDRNGVLYHVILCPKWQLRHMSIIIVSSIVVSSDS